MESFVNSKIQVALCYEELFNIVQYKPDINILKNLDDISIISLAEYSIDYFKKCYWDTFTLAGYRIMDELINRGHTSHFIRLLREYATPFQLKYMKIDRTRYLDITTLSDTDVLKLVGLQYVHQKWMTNKIIGGERYAHMLEGILPNVYNTSITKKHSLVI